MAEKYTPNKPKDAGLEARQKLGWWHAYRFLIQTCQIGPLKNIKIILN